MNSQDYKILIVDDEPDILEFLGYSLKKDGYCVFTASNGNEALREAQKHTPHLILLDVMMPKMDGIETCEKLKTIPELKSCIIAFLTARNEDYSEIAGFQAGADDYITKPVRPKVLLARIQALLNRKFETNQELVDHKIYIEDIIIDIEKHLVTSGDNEYNLPKKEFQLLLLLTSKPEKVFTRDEIFNTVWGSEAYVGDRTIDVHIRKLREKIGNEYFETIKGIGYKFTRK